MMRIIDKNNDYYDYLQDFTDDLVFDRRNSFILTKEMVCNGLHQSLHYPKHSTFGLIFLQCGATFWLMLATSTKLNEFDVISDYELKLMSTWKNYEKPNRLLAINVISCKNCCKNYEHYYSWNDYKYIMDNILRSTKYIVDDINQNNYKTKFDLSVNRYYTDYKNQSKLVIKTIPLLKACGIPNIIDAPSIFWAIEEYFSIEKSKLETTEAKGTTDNDKIEMHGFDVKTSFRGK